VVALGEIPNPNPLLWIKFCGSNRSFRMGLVGVILEIDLDYVLKSRQTMQFLFIIFLGNLKGLNKIFHYF
jgi:hypothetical protein